MKIDLKGLKLHRGHHKSTGILLSHDTMDLLIQALEEVTNIAVHAEHIDELHDWHDKWFDTKEEDAKP